MTALATLPARLRVAAGSACLRRSAFAVGYGTAAIALVVALIAPDQVGIDARSYWRPDWADLYAGAQSANGVGVFRYSPAFAQLVTPLGLLSWPAFWLLWEVLLVGCLVYLGGRRWWLLLAFPPVVTELFYGNVHLFIAVAIVLAFRAPAAWAVPLFTKVTPGIGVLWFALRGEWRRFGRALVAVAIVVGISALMVGLAPWQAWVASLLATGQATTSNQIPIPLLVRLPFALGVLAVGARTGRRWTIPVAAVLALPTLWLHGLSILAAVPRLQALQADRGDEAAARAADAAPA